MDHSLATRQSSSSSSVDSQPITVRFQRTTALLRRFVATLLMIVIAGPVMLASESDSRPGDQSNASSGTEAFISGDTADPVNIARLIEGLASDSYATRIRCRDRLARIGLAAFDQLRQARTHPDSEVAIVARRLTSGLQVRWSTSNDSAEAQELLSEYGSRSVIQRRQRIELLAELPRHDAFSPLLRLARFETDPSLARAAALALIGRDVPPLSFMGAAPGWMTGSPALSEESRLNEATQIEKQLRDDDRIANQWLLQFAGDLRSGTIDATDWRKLILRQREYLVGDETDALRDEAVSTRQILELIRVTAERELSQNLRAEATELVVVNVDLIPSRTRELIETATWAFDHSLHPAIVAMQDAHKPLFKRSPILLYFAAEANDRVGQETIAETLAESALAINPLPDLTPQQHKGKNAEPPTDKPALHRQTIENLANAHIAIAEELAEKGLFRWAEREYKLILERLPIDTVVSATAATRLASMLGELQRHAEVVEVLTPLAHRIEKDDTLKERLTSNRYPYPDVQSDVDFHRGLLLIEEGNEDAAKPILRKAFELNEVNVDILIAMYHLKGDTQWEQSVHNLLDEQIRLAELKVIDARNSVQRSGSSSTLSWFLSRELNGYAWLVSNTEGDKAKALRYSKESLQLTPNQPAWMDTCARCYFAVGDLEKAVAMQSAACEKMPHSPPLRRQLKEFQEALRAANL